MNEYLVPIVLQRYIAECQISRAGTETWVIGQVYLVKAHDFINRLHVGNLGEDGKVGIQTGRVVIQIYKEAAGPAVLIGSSARKARQCHSDGTSRVGEPRDGTSRCANDRIKSINRFEAVDDRRCDERGREETTHLEDKAFGGTVDHSTVVAARFDIIDQIINVFLQAWVVCGIEHHVDVAHVGSKSYDLRWCRGKKHDGEKKTTAESKNHSKVLVEDQNFDCQVEGGG